jgi:hypothetical protein
MDIFIWKQILYGIGILLLLVILLVFIGRYTNERIINALDFFLTHSLNSTSVPARIQVAKDSDVCTLRDFVRQNAPLFTIIGITGTMLSLIPTFLEKFIGVDWNLEILSSFSGIFLLVLVQFLIFSIGGFIFFISVLILKDLFSKNFGQDVFYSIFNFDITEGILKKMLFAIIFVPVIGGFV